MSQVSEVDFVIGTEFVGQVDLEPIGSSGEQQLTFDAVDGTVFIGLVAKDIEQLSVLQAIRDRLREPNRLLKIRVSVE